MKCVRCGKELDYCEDGFYKAEVIKPHGYVAPVKYFKCPSCGTIFREE